MHRDWAVPRRLPHPVSSMPRCSIQGVDYSLLWFPTPRPIHQAVWCHPLQLQRFAAVKTGTQCHISVVGREGTVGPPSACVLPQVCSGRGDCLGASGYCDCYVGYSGSACQLCARNFTRVKGACVFLPGAMVSCSDGVRNGNEVGMDCGGPNCVACTSASLVTPRMVRLGCLWQGQGRLLPSTGRISVPVCEILMCHLPPVACIQMLVIGGSGGGLIVVLAIVVCMVYKFTNVCQRGRSTSVMSPKGALCACCQRA
jgi:hypothetical protein